MLEGERKRGRTRAQSEVLSYILVFAIIIAALSVVSVFGVTALEQVQEKTVADNGEFAMQNLEADIGELYHGTSTSESTELSLGSASLETGSPVTIEVSGSTPLRGSVSGSWTYRPIAYRSDAADIVYDNSMVVREQDRGAVAVSEPLFELSDEQTVVPVVRTVASGPQSVSGGTYEIATTEVGTETLIQTSQSPPASTVVDVDLAIELNTRGQFVVWKRQLNEELAGVSSPRTPPCQEDSSVDNRLVCEFDTDTLVVSVVHISFDFR